MFASSHHTPSSPTSSQRIEYNTLAMPGPWDAVSERKLLLCIIGLQAKLEWEVIAKFMGDKFTAEACRYVHLSFRTSVQARSRIALLAPWSAKPCVSPAASRKSSTVRLVSSALQQAPPSSSSTLIRQSPTTSLRPYGILKSISFSSSQAILKTSDLRTYHRHQVSQLTMPPKFSWTVENERNMLLLAISKADLKPSVATWTIVAEILGGEITPSAVRCGRFLKRPFLSRSRSALHMHSPPLSRSSPLCFARRQSFQSTPADYEIARSTINSKESPRNSLVPRRQLQSQSRPKLLTLQLLLRLSVVENARTGMKMKRTAVGLRGAIEKQPTAFTRQARRWMGSHGVAMRRHLLQRSRRSSRSMPRVGPRHEWAILL